MKMKILLFLLLTLSLNPSFAVKYIPLDIADGMWEIKFNFENLLTAKQKAQMKQALERLEQMKKQNPEMAAQLAQVTKSMGVTENSVTKKNCITHENMQKKMNEMISSESSSEVKCKGQMTKSSEKLLEGVSVCGDKTHSYKITVQDKKHMKSVVTTSDGKTMEGTFKWLASKCEQ